MFIDLLFLIVVVYGFYLGYSKGMLKVIAVFVLFLLAVMVSMLSMPITVELLHAAFELNNRIIPYVAFFLTLVIFSFSVLIITGILNEYNQNKNVTIYGKGFAGLFMAAFFLFIYSGLIGFLSESRLLKREAVIKQSITYDALLIIEKQGTNFLKYSIPFSGKFYEYVDESNQKLDSIDKKSK